MTSEIMAMQYQCPECNKSFEKEHSLDQHMRATGHEFVDEEYSDEEYCADDCECNDCQSEDWDDDTPSVDLSIFKPRKQASKKTLRIGKI